MPCIIFSNVYLYIHVPCVPFFLINHNQKQVLLIKESSFFEAQKNVVNVCHIHNIVLIFDQRYETQR